MKKFDIKSGGFIQSVIVAFLAIFAATGVTFPKDVNVLGMELVTSFSAGGIYAIIGILITAVIFPIYNFFSGGGKFSLPAIFSRVNTWLSIGYALAALIALTGFVLPDGSVDQIVYAIYSKDWGALIAFFATTIVPTFVRWLKARQASKT